MKCPMCGKEFEEFLAACANCPFKGNCDLLKCPNCGYEFPRSSKIVDFITGLFRKKRRKPECPPKK